ncbi:MAG: hypothetical protein AB1454_14105 [Candidatus Auribacterota bacterium]
MKRKTLLNTLVFTAVLFTSSSLMADVITYWNNVTLDVIRNERVNPPRATRMLAMVHIAMYNATNDILNDYEPYPIPYSIERKVSRLLHLQSNQARKHASPDLSASFAAYTVLAYLYPSQSEMLTEKLFYAVLKHKPYRPLKILNSRVWGYYCALEIILLRRDDGSDDTVEYEPSNELGRWMPTPPNFAPALLPQWRYVTPFAMASGDQFIFTDLPALDSEEFALSFNQVKELGDIDSLIRTPDQTEIAYFWEDGAGTVTPPGHWQVIAQDISEMFGLSMMENARLFALLSIGQADAAITSWENKYRYDFVRPYTAITGEAAGYGNDLIEIDPDWYNLLPTPPFPSCTSGHSTFSSCSAAILERFFGTDDIAFSASSPDPERWPDELPGVVRSWSSFSQAAEEAGISRIYGGIHWSFDNVGGLQTGRELGYYVFDNFLLPKKVAWKKPWKSHGHDK